MSFSLSSHTGGHFSSKIISYRQQIVIHVWLFVVSCGKRWMKGQFRFVLYNQANFYRFYKKHSDISQEFFFIIFPAFHPQFSFSLLFIGHHLGSTFTGRDRNGPNYSIGPKRAWLPIRPDIQAVHGCNSWFEEVSRTAFIRFCKIGWLFCI